MNRKKKQIILIACGVLLIAVAVCTVWLLTDRKEAFRTIQVYQVEGSAMVDRAGVGSIDAYTGMMLQSGDTVYTNKGSCLYFKMDEDKYALLEPESTVRMEATGSDTDSKTTFYLESGALVSRLDNKLSPESVYRVNTPNSTMAVRGTVFRIEITYDESGVSYTNVYVFDGTVECRLVFGDGSVGEEANRAQKGVMVCIRGDNTTSEYILENGTVDYGQLPAEVLFFLKTAIEEGVELPLDMEELEAALAEIESVPAEIEIDTHIHSGGTATCISPALCTSDDCGQTYGEKDAGNHTGGTEIRDKTDATCAESGYTGDTYCMGCGELLQTGSVIAKDGSIHVGGTELRNSVTANCCNAGYTGDTYCLGCGELLQTGSEIAKDSSIHVGGTELRNSATANCCNAGYTGDTYCLGCGELLQNGSEIAKDSSTHVGGTEIRNSVDPNCSNAGYTGDTCCMGCGQIIQTGAETEKDGSTHVGGAERRDSIAASCCNAGYTGDVYCSGCGAMIEKGTTIAATGEHPAAICGANGHHAHDGKVHEIPVCGKYGHCISDGLEHKLVCDVVGHCISDGFDHDLPSCGKTGHCISDGLDHNPGSCGIYGHYKCDGILHGDNCKNQDAVEQIPAS